MIIIYYYLFDNYLWFCGRQVPLIAVNYLEQCKSVVGGTIYSHLTSSSLLTDTLEPEPHYNIHFGVRSEISVITEQPYNEGLIHRKYKQWEPYL